MLALALLLDACAGAQPVSPPRSATAPVAPTAPTDPLATISLLPALRAVRIIATRPDGSYEVTAGGVRAILSSTGATLAVQASSSVVTSVTEVRGGMVVRTAEGGFAFSPGGWLGALEDRGSACPEGPALPASLGLATALDDVGTLRVTDGADRVGPVIALADRVVLSARFLDERRGVALLDGGGGVFTQDGGEHWSDLDLGDSAAAVLLPTPGGTRIPSPSGALRVDPSGTVDPDRGPSPGAPPPQRVDTALERALWAAIRARYHAPVSAGSALPARPHADGTTHLADGAAVLVLGPDGAEMARYDHALPGEDCALTPWGGVDAAVCDAPDGPVLYRVEGGHATPVALDVHGPAAYTGLGDPEALAPTFSDDGLHAVARGACEPDAPDAPEGHSDYCVLRDGSASRRTLRLDAPWAEFLGAHGALALMHAPVDVPGALGDVWVLDLDTGHRAQLEVSVPPGAPPLLVSHARFAADGTVYGMARGVEDVPRGVFVVGRVGEKLTVRALPRGAQYAVLASAREGVAVGETFARVWLTMDGGASWWRVPEPAGADPRLLDYATMGDDGGTQCSAVHCLVAHRMMVRGFGRPEWSGEFPAAATRANCPDVTAMSTDPTPVWCEQKGPTEASRALPRGAGSTARGARVMELGGAGARVRLAIARAPGGGLHASAAWVWSANASGRVQRAQAAGVVEAVQASAEWGPDPGTFYLVLGASERALLLQRCVRDGEVPCALWWFTAGGGVRALPDEPGLSAAAGSDENLVVDVSFVPEADGGGWVMRTVHTDAAQIDVALRVTPDGRVTARREFGWAARPGRTHALGTGPGGAVLVVSDPDAPLVLRAFALDAARDAPPVELGELPSEPEVCRGPPAPGALMFADGTASGAFALVGVDVNNETDGDKGAALGSSYRPWIEVHPGGAACVRAVDRTPPAGLEEQPEDAVRAAWAWAANGALEGRVDDGHRTIPIRCAVQSADVPLD